MARTRTTIRRIDPWSILKFGFVANLVLLGIELLAGLVVWYVIQRLELIQSVCELAATVGFEECGVDGGALFDTFLVLGLLGVVIQTGIMVFLTFLANLIFDLTGGIVVTLEDDRAPGRRGGVGGAGVGTRATGAAAMTRSGSGGHRGGVDDGGDSGTGDARAARGDDGAGPDPSATTAQPPVPALGSNASSASNASNASNASSASAPETSPSPSTGQDGSGNEDTLFG